MSDDVAYAAVSAASACQETRQVRQYQYFCRIILQDEARGIDEGVPK
jgi:hypothetical protein